MKQINVNILWNEWCNDLWGGDLYFIQRKKKNWGNVLTTGELENNITSEIQGCSQYSFSNIDTMF